MKTLCAYLIFFLNLSIIYLLYNPNSFDITNYQVSKISPSYDFIVVGAGSAGCVVASRLAMANYTVLVLEAGGSDRIMPPLDPIKMSIAIALLNNSNYLYNYLGDYQFFNEESVRYTPRGKLVGGTGSINMQIWNRGNKEIYNKWAQLGNHGWDYESIKQYFEKAEQTMNIEKSPNYLHESSKQFLEAARKLFGSFADPHENEKGFGFWSSSTKNGFRHTSCDAYMKPLFQANKAHNLHVKLFSTVNKLLIDPVTKVVKGVEFVSADDLKNKFPKLNTVAALKEVIISAGAYNTPGILQRSGIGNSSDLDSLNIPVISDLPGVGLNHQDHYAIFINYKVKRNDWPSAYLEAGAQTFYDAWKHGSGPMTTQGMEIQGFFKSSHPKYKDINDFHYLCGPVMGGHKYEDMPEWYQRESMFSCIIVLATPKQSGSVKIRSKNAADHPKIKGVYLNDDEELENVYEAFKNLRKVFESEGIREYVEEVYPKKGEITNLSDFSRYAADKYYNAFHPVGTCKMGDRNKDPKSVVDSELKVYGVKGVRVIDGSVFPEITNLNTNAPIIMIAEKGADMILKEHIQR